MKKFDKIKKNFIERCKENSACEPEFKRVIASENETDLLQVVMDNFSWCYEEKKIIDVPWLLEFKKEIREDVGVFVNLKIDKLNITKNCYVISSDGSNIGEVISSGSSNIGYVRSYGSSNIGYVRSYDSSKIGEVRSSDGSNIGEVRSSDSSDITINGIGDAKITVDGAGCIKSLSDYKIYLKKNKFTIQLID